MLINASLGLAKPFEGRQGEYRQYLVPEKLLEELQREGITQRNFFLFGLKVKAN